MCDSKKQINPFTSVLPLDTSDYGYASKNPIQIGFSKDVGFNIDYCHYFIENLRTENGQRFKIVSRSSVNDLFHDTHEKGFLEKSKNESFPIEGILDEYQLITEDGTDTLFLFFDIYQKNSLRVPKGLTFVGLIDS